MCNGLVESVNGTDAMTDVCRKANGLGHIYQLYVVSVQRSTAAKFGVLAFSIILRQEGEWIDVHYQGIMVKRC